MKKLFKIDESERERILNFHQFSTKKQYLNTISEQILGDSEKTSTDLWIDENNVKFSTWAYPNPFKPGMDLSIGVKSSIDFPEMQRVGDPDSAPYHYFRDKVKSRTTKLIIKNLANQIIANEEISPDEFNVLEDDGFYMKFPADSDMVQNILSQDKVYIQFFTEEMYDALSPKLVYKPFLLIIEK